MTRTIPIIERFLYSFRPASDQPAAGGLSLGEVEEVFPREVDIPVAEMHAAPLPLEPGGQALGQMDRSVAAAGAADGDGEVALALALVSAAAAVPACRQGGEERREGRIGLDEIGDGGVAPGVRPQRSLVMRIAQEAHVEHQVGFARQAVAVGEGDHRQRRLGLLNGEVAEQHLLEIAEAQLGGVDDEIGDVPQRRQQRALPGDAVDHRPVGRQRMAAARFLEAALQHVVAAIEIEQAQLDARKFAAAAPYAAPDAATEKSRVRLSTPMAIGRASISGFSIRPPSRNSGRLSTAS